MMNPCVLRSPVQGDWPRIARLLAATIPNALVSHFGWRFGALYYWHLAASVGACSFVAVDDAGTLAGVIIGTFDRQRSRQLSFLFKLRLLFAAHYRILSPRFMRWLANSRRTAIVTESAASTRPRAGLLAIAVDSRFRRQQLASLLLERVEMFFRENGLRQPYMVLTEQTNLAANRFYEKNGAQLAGTNLYHGQQINEWHKTLP